LTSPKSRYSATAPSTKAAPKLNAREAVVDDATVVSVGDAALVAGCPEQRGDDGDGEPRAPKTEMVHQTPPEGAKVREAYSGFH